MLIIVNHCLYRYINQSIKEFFYQFLMDKIESYFLLDNVFPFKLLWSHCSSGGLEQSDVRYRYTSIVYFSTYSLSISGDFFNQQQSSADLNFDKIYFYTFTSMPKRFRFFFSNTVTKYIFGVIKVILQICALLKVAIKLITTLNGFYRFLDAFISEFAVILPRKVPGLYGALTWNRLQFFIATEKKPFSTDRTWINIALCYGEGV